MGVEDEQKKKLEKAKDEELKANEEEQKEQKTSETEEKPIGNECMPKESEEALEDSGKEKDGDKIPEKEEGAKDPAEKDGELATVEDKDMAVDADQKQPEAELSADIMKEPNDEDQREEEPKDKK